MLDEQNAARRVGAARIGIGLIQGIVLWLLLEAGKNALHRVWPATDPVVYAGLVVMFAFAPLVLLRGVGSLRTVTLVGWGVTAAVLTYGLAAYGAWRENGGSNFAAPFATVIFTCAALFIAHHLIAAADAERRLIAPYPAYFDAAWKHAVQLVLAWLFIGAMWAILGLGALLFGLIGIKFLAELMTKPWFFVPLTTTAFAAAVHLTDVRAGLIRGIRTVALTLLSWLMPLMGAIIVAFLVALPFTGLDPLWKLGRATAILLGAAGVLVILLNAAYQDGSTEAGPPLVLRWLGRATALSLVPLTAIAAYGLSLRIGQHGLTADRIIAFGCVLVAACYAIGYAGAAVSPGAWMKRLELTNVATAFVILGVILAIFSPIADPARISTADQVRRLEQGKIAPDKFDYHYLRWDGGRYGKTALETLAARKTGPGAAAIAERAKRELANDNRYDREPSVAPAPVTNWRDRLKSWPAGSKLPESFLSQKWDLAPCGGTETCDAYQIDLDHAGPPEILINSPGAWIEVYSQGPDGAWENVGHFRSNCLSGLEDALHAGRFATSPARWSNLTVGGETLRFEDRDIYVCNGRSAQKARK